jgi:hypothetical protein
MNVLPVLAVMVTASCELPELGPGPAHFASGVVGFLAAPGPRGSHSYPQTIPRLDTTVGTVVVVGEVVIVECNCAALLVQAARIASGVSVPRTRRRFTTSMIP